MDVWELCEEKFVDEIPLHGYFFWDHTYFQKLGNNGVLTKAKCVVAYPQGGHGLNSLIELDNNEKVTLAINHQNVKVN